MRIMDVSLEMVKSRERAEETVVRGGDNMGDMHLFYQRWRRREQGLNRFNMEKL